MTNTTHYHLIVDGNHFSLSNETDADAMSDYFPGIWAIKTQKSAMRFANELLSRGDTIEVTVYSPRNNALANKFIKELGLKQELFKEPLPVINAFVTIAGIPSNLSALKKYLSADKKITIVNYRHDEKGTATEIKRDTFVKRVQTNAVVLDKNGSDSWLEYGKASDWTFDNGGATKTFIDRDGARINSSRIIYIKN